MNNATPEIRREKITIPQTMTVKEIQAKYNVAETTARRSLKTGWLIVNYSKTQIIIDREHFNPAISYSIAKQVFWKKFRNH